MPSIAYDHLAGDDDEGSGRDLGVSSPTPQHSLLPDHPIRPPTYYGEGPFDPPSSEDEDEDKDYLVKDVCEQGLDHSEAGSHGLRVGKVSSLLCRQYLC